MSDQMDVDTVPVVARSAARDADLMRARAAELDDGAEDAQPNPPDSSSDQESLLEVLCLPTLSKYSGEVCFHWQFVCVLPQSAVPGTQANDLQRGKTGYNQWTLPPGWSAALFAAFFPVGSMQSETMFQKEMRLQLNHSDQFLAVVAIPSTPAMKLPQPSAVEIAKFQESVSLSTLKVLNPLLSYGEIHVWDGFDLEGDAKGEYKTWNDALGTYLRSASLARPYKGVLCRAMVQGQYGRVMNDLPWATKLVDDIIKELNATTDPAAERSAEAAKYDLSSGERTNMILYFQYWLYLEQVSQLVQRARGYPDQMPMKILTAEEMKEKQQVGWFYYTRSSSEEWIRNQACKDWIESFKGRALQHDTDTGFELHSSESWRYWDMRAIMTFETYNRPRIPGSSRFNEPESYIDTLHLDLRESKLFSHVELTHPESDLSGCYFNTLQDDFGVFATDIAIPGPDQLRASAELQQVAISHWQNVKCVCQTIVSRASFNNSTPNSFLVRVFRHPFVYIKSTREDWSQGNGGVPLIIWQLKLRLNDVAFNIDNPVVNTEPRFLEKTPSIGKLLWYLFQAEGLILLTDGSTAGRALLKDKKLVDLFKDNAAREINTSADPVKARQSSATLLGGFISGPKASFCSAVAIKPAVVIAMLTQDPDPSQTAVTPANFIAKAVKRGFGASFFHPLITAAGERFDIRGAEGKPVVLWNTANSVDLDDTNLTNRLKTSARLFTDPADLIAHVDSDGINRNFNHVIVVVDLYNTADSLKALEPLFRLFMLLKANVNAAPRAWMSTFSLSVVIYPGWFYCAGSDSIGMPFASGFLQQVFNVEPLKRSLLPLPKPYIQIRNNESISNSAGTLGFQMQISQWLYAAMKENLRLCNSEAHYWNQILQKMPIAGIISVESTSAAYKIGCIENAAAKTVQIVHRIDHPFRPTVYTPPRTAPGVAHRSGRLKEKHVFLYDMTGVTSTDIVTRGYCIKVPHVLSIFHSLQAMGHVFCEDVTIVVQIKPVAANAAVKGTDSAVQNGLKYLQGLIKTAFA